MKHYILISIALMLSACNSEQPNAIATIVMADRTDPNIPVPQADVIKHFCGTVKDNHSSVWLKFQNITNTDINESYVIALDAFSSFGNKLQRHADVQQFNATIDTLVIKENTQTHEYHSSSIIIPLIDRLTELSKRVASEKHLLLYSDISEFSDLFNVYDYQSQLRLENKPETVAEAFKSKLKIPNLTSITLHIIYYPKTTEQNRLFQSMIKVYRNVFKTSGLTIEIGIAKQL